MYFDYFTNGDLWNAMGLNDGVNVRVLLLPFIMWWLLTIVVLARFTDIIIIGVVTLATNPLSFILYGILVVSPQICIIVLSILAFLYLLGVIVRGAPSTAKEN